MDKREKISESPTNPQKGAATKKFDVADLYEGPLATAPNDIQAETGLAEKLRQAYFWLVNNAIISPYYDIEYQDGPSITFQIGDMKSNTILPSGQSYSSFMLFPLLALVTRKKCLLVGGPGRGKTASAMLMGLLAGYSMQEIKRGIQHGQPEMTVTDLLGNPLPSDLIAAQDMSKIRIAWRKWLSMRVKIIDEYNRIPTRTQSSLLTVMSDNYAEILDQIYECPDSAWYLTANDEAGGGTYQVIEALRDRIDVVVKALHFNMRFLGDLLSRIEDNINPEDIVPAQIIFTEDEISRIKKEILKVEIPPNLRRRIEFFASQFEFFEFGAHQLEYKTKDTVKLAGLDFHLLSTLDTGKDKIRDLGSQTLNGLSVRALMTILTFVKAIAYFRGDRSVSLEDIRQVIPFVLHDKLVPNQDAAFFAQGTNAVYRSDRIGWIRELFDMSCAEYDKLNLDKKDPLRELEEEFEKGLEGVSETEVRGQLAKIEQLIKGYSEGRKLYGYIYDNIIKLKYLHQRYSNYLRWLKWKS
jgi:MoxR-like ATPase